MTLRAVLAGLVLGLVLLPAGPAAAQGEGYVECADFTPSSVQQACDRAIPIECRGPDAPSDFDACLRENGTTPEAVRAALDAAQRAAGLPVGGIDAGLGGLAGGEPAPQVLPLAVTGALLLAALVAVRRRAPGD